MHPHQNPVYQSDLLSCFFKCYHNHTLKLKPDADEVAYRKEKRMEMCKLLTLQCTGISGCVYLERRFLSKAAHFTQTRRNVCFSAGFIVVSLLATELSKSQKTRELANKLALKYETELLEINPHLRVFYLPSVDLADEAASVERDADDTREDWATHSSQNDWGGYYLCGKDSIYEPNQGYSYGAPEIGNRSDD
jgi:hypothetical protein